MKIPECSYLSRRSKPTDDPAYLAFIRQLPCLICGRKAEPHHAGPRGLNQRAPDRGAIPLCRAHHRRRGLGGGPDSAHVLGKRFWQFHNLDRIFEIQRLNRLYDEMVERRAA